MNLVEICKKCKKFQSVANDLCDDCLNETVLLPDSDVNAPRSLVDETVYIEESATSTEYNNPVPPPISAIHNNVLYDRYEIVRVIGKGGMGTVYLARDLRLDGKELAIKEVTLNTTESKEFIDEAKMLVQLEHPNLPKITDYYPPNDAGQTYLVMDYVKGQTLSDIFTQSNFSFSPGRIIKYAIQLCNLLVYLHTHKPAIIYRDLKPSNIMIDEKDNVQLIDFGIARKYQEGKHADTTLLGTENFAAPEQFMNNQQTDHRTDLYSFGATLYYLLSGGKYYHLVKKPLQDVNETLAPELCLIINTLLEYEPQKRYQSAKDVKSALVNLKTMERTKELQQNEPQHPPVQTKKTKPAKKPTTFKKKLKRFVFLVLFVIVLAGAAFGTMKYFETQHNPEAVVKLFEKAIINEDIETLSSLLTTDDARLLINNESLQGFLTYFTDNPKELQIFKRSLEQQIEGKSKDTSYPAFTLVEDEKLYFLIQTYKIQVSPVYFSVRANRDNTKIFINESEVGLVESAIYEQEFGPFIPGAYEVEAIWESELVTLKDVQQIDLLSTDEEKVVEFDLSGETINISANYQTAEIFINDESIQSTIAETASFGPIVTDGSMKIYVQQTFPWGVAKSEEQVVTSVEQLNFEVNPLTTTLQDSLFTIGNEYLQSVIQTYRTNDVTKLKHIDTNVQNFYSNLLTQLSVTEDTKIEKLKLVQYDLDTLDFYETGDAQYEVAVNVSFFYDATVKVEGAAPAKNPLTEHQKITYAYDNAASSWIIKDVIITNASPLLNVKEFSFTE